jgi:NADH-quinone oxidoreductase subunit F
VIARISDPTTGSGNAGHRRIIICAGTGCVANGAYNVYQELVSQLRAQGLEVVVELRKEHLEAEPPALAVTHSGCVVL